MATGLFTLKQQLQGLIQKAWTGTQKTNYVEYLVVAGGGGGAGTYGGGAGAGGLLTGIVPVVAGTSYTVTVGGGGNGGAASADGAAGVASVFGSITATRGDSGKAPGSAPYDLNASGGGGGGSGSTFVRGGLGIPGQGNNGGSNLDRKSVV